VGAEERGMILVSWQPIRVSSRITTGKVNFLFM
jgi:hypothetical protein